MYLADNAFRKAGVRAGSQITYASALPTIFAAPKYAEALLRVIERKGIETRFQHNLLEVRAAVPRHADRGFKGGGFYGLSCLPVSTGGNGTALVLTFSGGTAGGQSYCT